jgi:hypothetical protein
MGTEPFVWVNHWRQHLAGLLSGLKCEPPDQQEVKEMSSSIQPLSALENSWESLWAPYDESTYQAVLSEIRSEDTLLEIGAGDLRLARRMAAIAQQVYAIEIQKAVLEKALPAASLPHNLELIHADARTIVFPPGITTAILLMRHCTHYELYVKKLQAAGCNRLITNVRWGNHVEVIELNLPHQSFEELAIGWYACLCGAAGFKTGPLELLEAEWVCNITEVRDCPRCCATHGSEAKTGQINCSIDDSFAPIPIFPDLPTDIKTLYKEGA